MRSCFFCPFLWDHRLQIMIALNTGYFPACWGWDCWVFSAGGTRSQASSVLTWSNRHLNLTLCNLTLLNLTLPFLNFIFFNGAEWMRSCHKPCVESCTQGSGLVSMCFSWKGDIQAGSCSVELQWIPFSLVPDSMGSHGAQGAVHTECL